MEMRITGIFVVFKYSDDQWRYDYGGLALWCANIMFPSVTERTRNWRSASDCAKIQGSIMSQFIIEGLILVTCGSIVGLIASFGSVYLLGSMALPEFAGFGQTIFCCHHVKLD
ncbi:hypothetical protein O9993_02955 [Vibrio lentus]|nr:hypothetical protein [Vibrio lentus]